jgi:thymidylate synthase (FAD)
MKAELIDHMGSDLSVVNAARVSFDKVSEWAYSCSECGEVKPFEDGCIASNEDGCMSLRNLKPEDAKLIRYLAKHDHWTPFAHTSISLRMQAPVPIRTQCFKHKQGLVENEESRRYISGTPELFVPDAFRASPVGGAKQGSSGVHYDSRQWLVEYQETAIQCISLYEKMIADGVCPEQARFVLPQGCEVNWIWTGNLYAFANFYLKRTDPHAQLEVRQLAAEVGKIVEPLFPVSWAALTVGEA